ncbi:MAG: 4Fe-4S dicluster domain-containing protein [Candidatus Brocadiales bacterium]
MSIFIDENICDGCGKSKEARCVRICPGNLIVRKENWKACIVEQRDCWICAACVKECPVQAIELRLPFQIADHDASLKARAKRDKTIWKLKDSEGNEEAFEVPARK